MISIFGKEYEALKWSCYRTAALIQYAAFRLRKDCHTRWTADITENHHSERVPGFKQLLDEIVNEKRKAKVDWPTKEPLYTAAQAVLSSARVHAFESQDQIRALLGRPVSPYEPIAMTIGGFSGQGLFDYLRVQCELVESAAVHSCYERFVVNRADYENETAVRFMKFLYCGQYGKVFRDLVEKRPVEYKEFDRLLLEYAYILCDGIIKLLSEVVKELPNIITT